MELFTALKNLHLLHKLYSITPVRKIKHTITTPLRHAVIADSYFRREIEIGDVVTVSGYLSRYCQYFKPASYVPGVFEPTTENNKLSFDRFGNNPQHKISIELGLEPAKKAAIPLQALPPYQKDDLEYEVAFLYPSDFKSFFAVDGVEKEAKILESHKAIPVLLKSNDFARLTERNVKLTGQIHPIPQGAIEAYANSTLDPQVQELLYLHFRPTTELIGFVIDGREGLECSIKELKNDIQAGVYVEGHFESIPDDMFRYDFGNLIEGVTVTTAGSSKTPGNSSTKDISFRVCGLNQRSRAVYDKNIVEPYTIHYLRNDGINIMQYNNRLCFYTEYSLHNDIDSHSSITKLKSVYSDTWRSIKNYLLQETKHNVSFELDFMWDYRKKSLFHKNDFLNSNESNTAFQADRDLLGTRKWLKP